MKIKYPEKAAKWQPHYIGFQLKQVEIDVDTQVFGVPAIERTLSMLSDQIEAIEIQEQSGSEITIQLGFFSDLDEQEIEDLFYSKLICAKVMLLTFDKTKDLRQLFQNTAQFSTTSVQEQINAYREKSSNASSSG